MTFGPLSKHRAYAEPVKRVGKLRITYEHVRCHGLTTIGNLLAGIYASRPLLHIESYCAKCRHPFPIGEFIWPDNGRKLND